MAPVWPGPHRSLILRRSSEDATGAIVASVVAAVLLVIGLAGHLIRDRVRRRRDAAEARRASKGKQLEQEGGGVMLDKAEEAGRGQRMEESSRNGDVGQAGKNKGGNETGKDGKRAFERAPPALPESRSRTEVKSSGEKERDVSVMEKKLG